jgi:hypothetical protein
MSTRSIRSWTLTAGLTLLAALALADPVMATPQEDARQHYQRGKALFDVGRYREAAVELRRAHDLDPNPALLYNIARALEEDFQLERALGLFNQFIEAIDAPAARARAELSVTRVQALARELETHGVLAGIPRGAYELATIDGEPLTFREDQPHLLYPPGARRLSFRYANGFTMTIPLKLREGQVARLADLASHHGVLRLEVDPVDARLEVDGRTIQSGRAVTLRAGEHTVTARAPGFAAVERSLTVSPEVLTTTTLVLVTAARPAVTSTARLPLSPLWIGAGAAAVGLGVGVALQVTAASERDQVLDGDTSSSGLVTSITQVEARAIEDRAWRLDLGAFISYGVAGAAALATSIYAGLVLEERLNPEGRGLVPARIEVGPRGVGVGWTF